MRPWSFFATIFLTTIFAEGKGVFVSKEQNFHSDDSAKAVKFDTINPQGFVTWFNCNGMAVRLEATQWFRFIEFPPPLAEATDPKILPARVRQLKTLEDFSTQFKKASPLMKTEIANIQSEIENLKNGLVLHESTWISRIQYETSVKEKSDVIKRNMIAAAAEEERKKQQELARLTLETELQSKRTAERRELKIHSLRDQLSALIEEKTQILQQNKNLEQELLNITDNGKIDQAK